MPSDRVICLIVLVTCLAIPSIVTQSANEEISIGTEADCNKTERRVNQSAGVLVFPPEGSGMYLNDCEWVVTIAPGYTERPLELAFFSFQLGVGDYMTITNIKYGGTYNVIFSPHNTPAPEPIIIEPTDAFEVILYTDDYHTSTGFKLSWGILYTTVPTTTTTEPLLPKDTVFKVVVKSNEYFLKSPNYPGFYPKNKKLYWVLTAAEPTDRIKLKFADFQLAIDDTVYIYEGSIPEEEYKIVQHSGDRTSLPKNVVSKGNQLLVVFYSSQYVNDKGFSIKYVIYVPPEPADTKDKNKTPISNKDTNKTPLSPESKAAIIVVSCLFVLIVFIACFYYIYWKPKQRAEEELIARELYDNGENTLTEDDIPKRPTTANEMARLRAAQHMKPDYGFGNPGFDEKGAPQLPDSLLTRPGSARPNSQQRPMTGKRSGGGPSVRFQGDDSEEITHIDESGWSQKLDKRFARGPPQPGMGAHPDGGPPKTTLPPLNVAAINSKPVKRKKKKVEKKEEQLNIQKELDILAASIAAVKARSDGLPSARSGSARPNSGRPRSARSTPRTPTTPTVANPAKLPGYVKRADEDE